MKCEVKRCKSESIFIIYYGFGICNGCWSKYCDNVLDLKKEFKISKESNGLISVDNNRNVLVYDDWKKYFNKL